MFRSCRKKAKRAPAPVQVMYRNEAQTNRSLLPQSLHKLFAKNDTLQQRAIKVSEQNADAHENERNTVIDFLDIFQTENQIKKLKEQMKKRESEQMIDDDMGMTEFKAKMLQYLSDEIDKIREEFNHKITLAFSCP